jgi:hypothetical protein
MTSNLGADPTSLPLTFAEGLDAAVRGLGDPSPSAVRIVAVDGHSGAGKSTFAAAQAARIAATLVPGDDFYRVMDEEVRARLSAHEGIGRYFDWERMRDEVLVPLRAGRDARYRPYDWDSGLVAETPITLQSAPESETRSNCKWAVPRRLGTCGARRTGHEMRRPNRSRSSGMTKAPRW